MIESRYIDFNAETHPPEPKLSPKDMEDLAALQPMIFGQFRPLSRGAFKTAYVYSETAVNDYSALYAAAKMLRDRMTDVVVLCDGPTNTGYEGYEHSKKVLGMLYKSLAGEELPEHKVRSIGVDKNVNTRTEADALMLEIRDNDGDVAVIAPPFHLTRAYMTTITAMRAAEKAGMPPKNIFSVPGLPQPWTEVTPHSQGVVTDTRADLFAKQEMMRLRLYQEISGRQLLAPVEVREYMLELDDRIRTK